MKNLKFACLLLSATMIGVGCERSGVESSGNSTPSPVTDGHDHDHDHATDAHAAPHGGHLIELGHDHQYHAELVDDHETKTVTVYVTDHDLQPLALNAATINLKLTVGGQTQAFDLGAVTGEPKGQFQSDAVELWKMLESSKMSGKVTVIIDDKPFAGTFDHHAHDDHAHDDHDH